MTQDQALAILKTGRNVFLTGEPGSGKTHTVNRYVAYLRSCGIDPAITASTGIAATHIGGMTIHSWSGIGIRKFLSRSELKEMSGQDRLVNRLLAASILIIDEISMLDGRTLGLVDAVCRALRTSEKPFGGIQVVFVGDFFQLPPVSRDGDPTPQFAFTGNAWQAADPTTCYLAEHHRQDDEQFLHILRALRRGDVTFAEREQLLARRMTTSHDHLHADIPKLFPHNINVDGVNATELAKLSSPSHTFPMSAHGAKPLVEQLKRGCLSPEQLVLKKGARVMFTKNSFTGKFVNGTVGTVTGFMKESGQPIVQTRGGALIEVEPAQWSIQAGGMVEASITQLPLRLAWAMTVHKSQGMSLDAAFVDLSQAFVCGQGYVALSRVRSLNGLHLGGLNERALEVDGDVLLEDFRFRDQSAQAILALERMDAHALASQHEDFVSGCGGKIGAQKPGEARVKIKKHKQPSREKTCELVCSGMSLEQAAKERALTIGTLVGHLEELRMLGTLPVAKITHLRAAEESVIAKIHAAFHDLGADFLKPIRDRLGDAVSYDTIRLARLFFNGSRKE